VVGLGRRRFVDDVTEMVDDLLPECESRRSSDSYPESWRCMLTGLGGSDIFEEGAGVGAVGVETVVLELGG
jgi:hypothetical protein